MENTQLAERASSVRECLALPVYQNRFREVLRDRAPQFMSSLVQLSQDRNLATCDPKSVIGSAMIAATLDFPIEKSLGFAHIIPYGDKAQFQLGYKAYIQLAHRSGQYARLNAKAINQEAFKGFDEVGEPIIDWTKVDDTLPPVGYAFAFRLLNGFTKVCYWSKDKVKAHASRFSQAYKRGKQDSPWFTNFDAMALKTVIMNELRQWGVLSVQMQNALKADGAYIPDVDAEPQHIDVNDDIPMDTPPPKRPGPPPREKKGVQKVVETATKPAEPAPAPENVTPPAAPMQEAPAEPAQSPASAPAAHEPAETKAPEPTPVKPKEDLPAQVARAFLKDGEELVATCTVGKLECLPVKREDGVHPSVYAHVSGGFFGNVLHVDGAKATADKTLLPNPPWVMGSTLVLTLVGHLNKKDGKVIAMVKEVAEAGGPLEVS